MIGQLLDRRYQIIRLINSGTFTQIYLATDTHRPGSPSCVVREFNVTAKSAKTRQIIEVLFQKKAEVIERLGRHSQIPELLAVFQENNNFYLVEDFIYGQPLSDELIANQTLTESEVVELLYDVLSTLAFVHDQGIAHQSLSPSHIIRRDSDKKLVLINFGLQQEISSQMSNSQFPISHNSHYAQSQVAVSTEPSVYVAIEQRQGSPRANSDIYALGSIALQALTGHTELDLEKLPELKEPEATRTWQEKTECSIELASIINKMTEYYYDRRYQSVDEVLSDLIPLVAAEQKEVVTETERSPSHHVFTNAINHLNKYEINRSTLFILGTLALSILVILIGPKLWPNVAKTALNLNQPKTLRGVQPNGTVDDYDQILKNNPSDVESYYNRGIAYYEAGSYQAAIEDYTKAIKLAPNRVNAYYNRGLTYLDIGDKRSAIADFSQVIRLEPNDADAYFKRGIAYYELGDYRSALADHDQAIRYDPSNPDAYSERGLAKSALGDRPGALADLSQALNLVPNDANVYYNRGRVRFSMADYQGALEDYNKAIELDPKASDAYANRCSAKINLGQLTEAIDDCTTAIRLNSKHAAAYNNRCIANLQLGAYQKAGEDCSLTIGLNVNDPKAYSNRGLARLAVDNKTGAIEDFTEAIRLNPNDSVAYSNRGKTFFDLGNHNRAIEDYAQAIRLNPNNSTAYYNRGLVRKELKDLTGAIEDLQKSGNLFLEQGRADEYKKAQEQINQITITQTK